MSIPATGLAELPLIVEGRTKILVPHASLQSTVATKREPVFFNSAAEFNRDISVIAYSSFLSNPNVGFYNSKNNRRHQGSEVVMADSLCGTGARGLRVAVEAIGIDKIYFNDANPLAVEIAKKSSSINQVKDKCLFSVNDVCKFLLNGTTQRNDTPVTEASCQINNEEISSNDNNRKQRFTIVDLDPFGSPANYIDCVMRSVQNGGLVSITATDTAVLCGKYPDVCSRKYYGMSLSGPYSNELALRLLMSLMALTSSRLGIGIRPLFAHTNMHYVRIYVQAVLSSKMANSVFDNIGYIQHCFQCGNRTASSPDSRSEVCGQCSSSLKTAGWLWTGKIYDKGFIREMLARTYLLKPNVTKHKLADQDTEMAPSKEYNSEETQEISQNEREHAKKNPDCKKLKKVQRLLSKCIEEHDDIPFYFTSDEIASRLKIGPPSLETILDNLSKAGFRTSPTGLNSTGFKTSGKINEIMTFFRG